MRINTLRERILEALREGPMSDRELTDKLLGYGKPQQDINRLCRELAGQGYIHRSLRPIKNSLTGKPYGSVDIKDGLAQRNTISAPLIAAPSSRLSKQNETALGEEAIKHILNDWLIAQGWKTQVAWGGQHGIDIDARRGTERWIIEVKGCGSRSEMRVNYFLGILGETLQRMDDPTARYSIVLPDMRQFRNLWNKLPWLAKQRTTIDIILVSEDGKMDFLS